MNATSESLAHKIVAGERISQAEALALYRAPLEELGALANARRKRVKGAAYGGRGNEIVTYIIDRNINYTNICNVYCKFCAFYRTESKPDAYVAGHRLVSRHAGPPERTLPSHRHPRLQPARVPAFCGGL